MSIGKHAYSRPIFTPVSYDPSFKVPVRLAEPLWRVQLSENDVTLEILTLCAQLEPLCKPEYTEDGGRSSIMEFRNVLQPKANMIIEKMREFLYFLPDPTPTLKDYLKTNHLAVLFPKVISYITNPARPVFHNQKSSMENYFQHLGMLNQLQSMAHQLEYDAFHLANHKYMAHQFAVLYQAVNQAGPYLAEYKKDIERNFKPLKASLVPANKDTPPKLSDERLQWVHSITNAVIDEVTSFPNGLAHPLMPAITFVDQCC